MAQGKYKPWLKKQGQDKLEEWGKAGLSDAQIAKNIGISRSTYYEWLKLYPDISDAIKKGKELADKEVENALYKSALGYDYEEVQIETRSVGEKEYQVRRVTRKSVQPNVTAQIFWLKNRMPNEWKDRRDISLTPNIEESAREMEEYFDNKKRSTPNDLGRTD